MYHPEIVGAHCKLAARYRPFIHSSEYAMPCWLVVSALLRWSHHPAPCTSGMYHHSLGSVSLRLPGWYQFHRDLGLQWYQGGILYRFDRRRVVITVQMSSMIWVDSEDDYIVMTVIVFTIEISSFIVTNQISKETIESQWSWEIIVTASYLCLFRIFFRLFVFIQVNRHQSCMGNEIIWTPVLHL